MKFPRFEPIRRGHTRPLNTVAHSDERGLKRAYICVFCVNTGCRNDSGFLLVFIEDNRISIDGLLDDLETSLVCNTVSVAKSGRSGIVVSGHIMKSLSRGDFEDTVKCEFEGGRGRRRRRWRSCVWKPELGMRRRTEKARPEKDVVEC